MADPFVAYWKQQQTLLHRQNQQATQLARRDLKQIVQILQDCYGVRRIILFGSLVKGRFTCESDIDLAVEGLAPKEFFAVYNEINHLSHFNIDLKPLERLYPHFRRRVLTQGETLYETPNSG